MSLNMSFRMQISRCLSIAFSLLAFVLLVGSTQAVPQDDSQSPVRESPANDQDSTKADPLRAMLLTSKAFRTAVEKIQPSLVTIESFGGVGTVQGRIGGIRNQGEGNTTGILISNEGHIVTSTFNFIQQPPVITVITNDGKRHFAKLLGRDDTRKICVLKIDDAENITLPEMVDEQLVRVGQWAITVGVGYGDSNPAVSTGIISAKNRIGGRAIQTDSNISPANYGGPLIDIQGRLIGICVPMNPQSQAIGAGVEWYDSGIGFAIPLSNAEKLLDRLKAGEEIYPAFLGVRAMPNPKGDGVWIEEVVPESPAKSAGLLRGDVIVAIDGNPVHDMMSLRQQLNRFEAGTEIKLSYVPDEKTDEKEISVRLGQIPQPKDAPPQLEPPKIR